MPLRGLVAAALLLLGCGRPFWTPPASTPPAPTPPPGSAASITSIVLTRTACLGRCPHYQLTLRADGTASYTGVRDAARLGTFASHWSPEAFTSLAARLLRNGFFTHDRDLPAFLDAPATLVCVGVADPDPRHALVGGTERDYHYLWPLADQLDSIAGGLRWTRVSSDTTTRRPGCAA